MNRRTFLCGLILSTLAAPLAAGAPQVERAYQVGLLTLGADPARSGFWQKFLEAMRELNYVEGRNLIVRRAFAVLRLMTSSNFVGCSTGRSAGLAPLRILST